MAQNTPRNAPVIVWFRDDLRLHDHPALAAAAQGGGPLLCLYVHDEGGASRTLGGAARWWLAGSLRALAAALNARGGSLVLRRGPAALVVPDLARQTGALAVHANRRHDPLTERADDAVATALKSHGLALHLHQAALLFEPEAVRSGAGRAFSIFTAFWRTARRAGGIRAPLPPPANLRFVAGVQSDNLDAWRLEPRAPDWAAEMRALWTRGENGARQRLAEFVATGLPGYAANRDRPDKETTSRLSPHLRFGEISPVQVWHAATTAAQAAGPISAGDLDKFQAEIGWREFAYHLLAQHPDMARKNIQRRFDAMPWREDPAALSAWQKGRTGYPVVDAAMRQLWRTGWIHNRMRMVAASFLCKHLLIDWRHGEAWFWDTLVDADPATNPASWQWVAGSGADAAPYFRIFNPVRQGEKFDPAGDYVRRYVPELAHLPARTIHTPWTAPDDLIASSGGRRTYPPPLIEHAAARARALDAFGRIRSDGK